MLFILHGKTNPKELRPRIAMPVNALPSSLEALDESLILPRPSDDSASHQLV
jgi:hypothetical protein